MRASALLLAALGALGAGAMLGLFFTWSNAVTAGMARSRPASAVEVMVAANDAIRNPLFGIVFACTPLLLGAAGAAALLGRAPWSGALLLLAALVYAAGVLGVTGAVNLPLNDALESSGDLDPAAAWAAFAPPWNRWNGVRTMAALLSTAGAIAGAMLLAARG